MNLMKRYVSIILSFILIFSAVSSTPVLVGADPSAYYFIEKNLSMTGGSVDISEIGAVSSGTMIMVTAQPYADRFTMSLDVRMWDGSHDFTVSVPGVAHIDRDTLTFPMPESDVMVFASFTEPGYYSVFIRDMAHGTVTADPAAISGAQGTDVTLTIRPENGYRYVEDSLRVRRDNGEELFDISYMLDEITENSVYSINCFSNIEVYAEFEEAPSSPAYSVNIDGNIEHGSVVSDLANAEEGWTVALTALPEENSFFELQTVTVTKESGGSVETTETGGNSFTFIMPAEAVIVSAVFAVPVHSVTIVNNDPAETGCSVLENHSFMAVEWSDTVSLAVNIFENCAMDSIEVTGDESGSVIPCALDHHSANSAVYYYRFVMPNEPVTVSAVFSIAKHNITVGQTVLGDVVFNVNGVEYGGTALAAIGEEVSVTYTADTIKYISSLTYTYTSVSGTRTFSLKNQTRDGDVYTGSFTMPASDVIFGVIYDKPYEIIIDDASFASLNVYAFASSYRADEGDTLLVELLCNDYGIPAPAWHMTYTDGYGEHEVDFVEISARSREYIMPASNVVISADPDFGYEVSKVWVTGGGLTVSHETAKFGQTVTLTVAPDNSGYEILLDVYYYDMFGYTAKCSLTHTSAYTYTFTMPAARVYVEMKCYNYVDRIWNGSIVEESYEGQADYIRISHLSVNADTLSNGWYYLDENRTFDYRLQISGTVNLILEDGMTLTCTKGIRVPEGAVLHIYGQKADSGKIIANAKSYEAAIGSNDQDDGEENGAGSIYIHGGNITATGGSDAAGIGGGNEAHGGSVTIYGGTVTANAGTDAAGIGSGDEYEGNHVFRFTVYGGTVTATGGECGAGIGGGDNVGGGIIRICGGSVTAHGGKYAAGIGGGEDGHSDDITIMNATIFSESEYEGAGIGGGRRANSGTITISNSKLEVISGYFGGAGIGGGQNGTNGNITISDSDVTVLTHTLNKGLNGQGAGIGAGMGRNQEGYIKIYHSDIFVETANGAERGDGGAAGIGGGDGGNGGYIYISESNITSCAYGGAGIGGGDGGECGTVEIVSSKVLAVSACRGAGIGGGDCKGGGTVIITDSEVTAIGGSSEYLPTNLVKPRVTSTTSESWYYLLECIILTSSCRGAGIGGGDGGNGSSVTITNSRVIASSKKDSGAKAIGRGKGGSNDGTLTFIGNEIVYTGSTQKKDDEYIFAVSGKAAAADRVSVCQTNNMVMIDICSHPNAGYTVTENTHTMDCIYCGASVTEGHSFDPSTHVCVCGYEDSGAAELTVLTLKHGSTLDIYSKNGTKYVSGMPFGIKISDLTVNFKGTVNVTDKTGGSLSDGDALVNGYRVTLTSSGDTAYVIIKGDADSNGRLSVADYMRIRRCFVNAFTLNGADFEAADVDGNGIISQNDYLAIKAHFKNGMKINSSFTNANITE